MTTRVQVTPEQLGPFGGGPWVVVPPHADPLHRRAVERGATEEEAWARAALAESLERTGRTETQRDRDSANAILDGVAPGDEG